MQRKLNSRDRYIYLHSDQEFAATMFRIARNMCHSHAPKIKPPKIPSPASPAFQPLESADERMFRKYMAGCFLIAGIVVIDSLNDFRKNPKHMCSYGIKYDCLPGFAMYIVCVSLAVGSL